MKEVYRKFGCTVRFENGTWIAVHEAGEAIETDETFIAAPLRLVWAGHPCLAGQTRMSVPYIPLMERLVLSEGIALHQFNDVEWREETRRLHVSLTHNRMRAVIDLDDFDFDLVNRVAESLARAGKEREVHRIRIAPHVARRIDLPDLWQNAGGRDVYPASVHILGVDAAAPDGEIESRCR